MSEAISIRSLMHKPAVVVAPQMTLSETARVLGEHKVGAAAVIDGASALVGVVSERDVLRSIADGLDPHTTAVGDVMTDNPVTVRADSPVSLALEIFRTRRFRHLPVVDVGGEVVGILSIRHVVRIAHIEEVEAAIVAPHLAPRGLEGVAVAETAVGDVRGEEGFFHYRGYNAVELARRCSFEQVWHLLLHGDLPDDDALREFSRRAAAARTLPDGVEPALAALARLPGYAPLTALRSAISAAGAALGLRAVLDMDTREVADDALRMVSLVPVLLTRLHRAHLGLAPVEPDADLGFAAAYLQMLTGERPDARAARAVETYLILTMDHGFNSSTFTARVITSTGSDMGSALTGALGALAGPLHGGAPSRALDMLDRIGDAENAENHLRAEVAAGRRLMGFGHRIYKTDDPRSVLLREVAMQLGGPQVEFARHVESTALRILEEMKPGRRLYTNVEFYAGVVMNSAGISRDMFTPTFACSRMVGWTSAVVEQAANNRLIRPTALYVGPAPPRSLPPGYGAAPMGGASAA